MGSGAISEPSADGVATDAAAGGSREPPGGSGRLVPSFGVASPLLLQLTQDQSWLPSIKMSATRMRCPYFLPYNASV